MNSTQVEIILSNSLNCELTEFIAGISPETTIFQQEISEMQPFFAKYKAVITELTWTIKRSYHLIYGTMNDEAFLELIEGSGRKVAYNNIDKLECMDFTQFYPDQLFPEGTKYPDDLMLKCMLYGKLAMFSRTLGLVKELNCPWELPTGESDFIKARGLGFYTYQPGKDKVYDFMNQLSEGFLENIMMYFTETLVRTGVADPRQLMIDSTTLYARKDDPDVNPAKTKRGDPSRCYKVQILCDLEQSPLVVLRRPGEEHDAAGFESCQPKLLWLKGLAEKYGVRLEFFLGDAGYFGQDIMDFIQKSLGAHFILDINPRQSKRFARIKLLFTDHRDLSAQMVQPTKLSEAERQHIIQQQYHVIQSLTRKLEECEANGTDFEQYTALVILKTGVENYLLIYRRRAVIEGLIGHL